MTILIIEDERPAADKLMAALKRLAPSATLEGPLRSVKETVEWLSHHTSPDLIIADIQLADGLSLDALRTVQPSCPIIFATAFDAYWMEALRANGIDYLLKPLKEDQLSGALQKVARLREHFGNRLAELLRDIAVPGARRQRIVVRKAADFVAVPHEEIAYLFTEHKVVFLVDAKGQRYLADGTLGEIESKLDPRTFFRANRQFLVRITAVAKYRPLEKGKLRVELTPLTSTEVVVSQENAADFKKWLGA